jgi:hypothetical protein
LSPLILLSDNCSFYFNSKSSHFLDTIASEISLGTNMGIVSGVLYPLSAPSPPAVALPPMSGSFHYLHTQIRRRPDRAWWWLLGAPSITGIVETLRENKAWNCWVWAAPMLLLVCGIGVG